MPLKVEIGLYSIKPLNAAPLDIDGNVLCKSVAVNHRMAIEHKIGKLKDGVVAKYVTWYTKPGKALRYKKIDGEAIAIGLFNKRGVLVHRLYLNKPRHLTKFDLLQVDFSVDICPKVNHNTHLLIGEEGYGEQ